MPWIELRRAADVGAAARRMTFRVDGRTVARLRRGASARVEVEPGSHVVEARMDWLRSPPLPVTVDADSPATVTAALPEHAMTFTGAFLQPRSALEIRLG